jgi:hypothetical protein
VELGHIDILTEVSLLSSYFCLPREGHVDAVNHLFAHLALNHNARVVVDQTYPQIDEGDLINTYWKAMYWEIKEAVPIDAPTPLGQEVDLRLYVDSDHAREKLTQRYRTGFVIYLNTAPIFWFSKQQPTLNQVSFKEFVAMKNVIETFREIGSKLQMMDLPLSDPCYVYGDNMYVIHDTQRPESVQKKKSNSSCYHVARESAAMGGYIMAHVPSDNNPADICNKVEPARQKISHLIGLLLYDLAD